MKKIFSDKRAIVIFLLPAALVYPILSAKHTNPGFAAGILP